MALNDDQKLDLIVRAYAEGYQGDFEELFELEENLQKNEHPLVVDRKEYIPTEPPKKNIPKPTFKLADNFDDSRARDLIRSYDPAKPTDMPYGEPVVGTFGADEYADYKRGGFRLADLAGQPEVNVDDYLYNYTNTYQNGGNPQDNPKDKKKPYNERLVITPQDFGPSGIFTGADTLRSYTANLQHWTQDNPTTGAPGFATTDDAGNLFYNEAGDARGRFDEISESYLTSLLDEDTRVNNLKMYPASETVNFEKAFRGDIHNRKLHELGDSIKSKHGDHWLYGKPVSAAVDLYKKQIDNKFAGDLLDRETIRSNISDHLYNDYTKFKEQNPDTPYQFNLPDVVLTTRGLVDSDKLFDVWKNKYYEENPLGKNPLGTTNIPKTLKWVYDNAGDYLQHLTPSHGDAEIDRQGVTNYEIIPGVSPNQIPIPKNITTEDDMHKELDSTVTGGPRLLKKDDEGRGHYDVDGLSDEAEPGPEGTTTPRPEDRPPYIRPIFRDMRTGTDKKTDYLWMRKLYETGQIQDPNITYENLPEEFKTMERPHGYKLGGMRYENGGPPESTEDLKKRMEDFNTKMRNERLGKPFIDLSQPSDNTRTANINQQDIVDRYNVSVRKNQEAIYNASNRHSIGPDPLANISDENREIIMANRKREHLNNNLSQYQPGTQAYENLTLGEKLLVRGRKKATQMTLLPQYAFTFAGPSDRQYDFSKDWKGRFRNVGTGLAYFGAAETMGFLGGKMGAAFNKAYPKSVTGLNLRTNIPYYTEKAIEKTGIPAAASMITSPITSYFRPKGPVTSYSPPVKNMAKHTEDYYYGLSQDAQLKDRILLAKDVSHGYKYDLGPEGIKVPMTSRKAEALNNRIRMMEQQLDEGVPARLKGSHEDIRANPAFSIPGKGGPAAKTMSTTQIGNYRDDLYNYYYAIQLEKGLSSAEAKKRATSMLKYDMDNSGGLFQHPRPSLATIGFGGAQKSYRGVGDTFGNIFLKDRTKLQKLTDPWNPFFNKEKFLINQQRVQAHELSHMWDQGGKLLSDKTKADLLKPFGMTLSEQRAATHLFKDAQRRGVPFSKMTKQEKAGYFMDPTEIAARIREGKKLFNLLPGQNMSRAQFDFWTKYRGAGLSDFDKTIIGSVGKYIPNTSFVRRNLLTGTRNTDRYGSGLTQHLWNEQARRESLGIGGIPHDDFYKLMLDPRFEEGGYRYGLGGLDILGMPVNQISKHVDAGGNKLGLKNLNLGHDVIGRFSASSNSFNAGINKTFENRNLNVDLNTSYDPKDGFGGKFKIIKRF